MLPWTLLDSALGKLIAGVVMLAIAFGAGFVYGHHSGYAGGQAQGTQEVATLQAEYARASEQAADAAKSAQAKADAEAIARADAQAAAAKQQVDIVKNEHQQITANLARLRAQLAKEIAHDQDSEKWAAACIPAGVRASAGMRQQCPKN